MWRERRKPGKGLLFVQGDQRLGPCLGLGDTATPHSLSSSPVWKCTELLNVPELVIGFNNILSLSFHLCNLGVSMPNHSASTRIKQTDVSRSSARCLECNKSKVAGFSEWKQRDALLNLNFGKQHLICLV